MSIFSRCMSRLLLLLGFLGICLPSLLSSRILFSRVDQQTVRIQNAMELSSKGKGVVEAPIEEIYKETTTLGLWDPLGAKVMEIREVLNWLKDGGDDRRSTKGLKAKFYKKTCHGMEHVVKQTTARFISRAPTLAAPLLRMHFHDCFVRGCDGSVLLNSTGTKQAEKDAIPNQTLRGFQVIDAAKSELEKKCPGVVSCADILALVARDAITMVNGPFWEVPLGRRDGKVSIMNEALENLPPPFANISTLKSMFASKGLNPKDLVVLSGGHTVGIAHCPAFTQRLYNFSGRGDSDPTMDQNYIATLRKKCRPGDTTTLVEMDPGSFKTFDQNYYADVAKRRGLFQSDAALLDDSKTKAYVIKQVATNGATFFKDFSKSMVKMGKIGVLTGKNGEIRRHCAFVN